MRAHCLFEQSGTFKNEFKKLGVEAFDYDILNDFGETDFQIDLFKEIENNYAGEASIFDGFAADDVVFAFFPCTRFEDKIALFFQGDAWQSKNWSDEKKIKYAMQLEEERARSYLVFSKLMLGAIRGGYRLIIENPCGSHHYLTKYFPIKPKLVDKNRRENGDWYEKPTQFWFVNCEPKGNLLFEPIEWVELKRVKYITKKGDINRVIQRSLIHPQYANRFIRQEILDKQEQ